MNEGEIILSLLFTANKQLAEAVEKGVRDLDHPASDLEVRIALYFSALLTSGADMGSVLTTLNGWGQHSGKDSADGPH